METENLNSNNDNEKDFYINNTNVSHSENSLLLELSGSMKNPYNFKVWWNLIQLEKNSDYYVREVNNYF